METTGCSVALPLPLPSTSRQHSATAVLPVRRARQRTIMTLFATSKTRSGGATIVLVGAAALIALAVGNHLVARRAERRHPPRGACIEVDGVGLHYSDRGEGSPVVLIHGNAVSGDDWDTSGVADLLLRNHR